MLPNKVSAANLIVIPTTGASGTVYNGNAVVNANITEKHSSASVVGNEISTLNDRLLNKYKS